MLYLKSRWLVLYVYQAIIRHCYPTYVSWNLSDCRANVCYEVYNVPRRLFNYSYRGYFILESRARAISGILITLPWHGHIHQVSNKIHRALRYLKFNKDLLSKQVQRHSYFTLVPFPPSLLPTLLFSRWIKDEAVCSASRLVAFVVIG